MLIQGRYRSCIFFSNIPFLHISPVLCNFFKVKAILEEVIGVKLRNGAPQNQAGISWAPPWTAL